METPFGESFLVHLLAIFRQRGKWRSLGNLLSTYEAQKPYSFSMCCMTCRSFLRSQTYSRLIWGYSATHCESLGGGVVVCFNGDRPLEWAGLMGRFIDGFRAMAYAVEAKPVRSGGGGEKGADGHGKKDGGELSTSQSPHRFRQGWWLVAGGPT